MNLQNITPLNSGGEYISGVCNIGPEEIKRRRDAAIFSGVLTVAEIILLLIFKVNPLWRLTLFLPATSLGVGLLQVFFKFCVNFGMRGVFNFEELGKIVGITEKDSKDKDRRKSRMMIFAGMGFGLVCSIIFYLI